MDAKPFPRRDAQPTGRQSAGTSRAESPCVSQPPTLKLQQQHVVGQAQISWRYQSTDARAPVPKIFLKSSD